MKDYPSVEVGQVYEEKDKRTFGRRVKVMALLTNSERASCAGCNQLGEVCTKRRTKIALKNLQTRFILITEVNQ